MTALTYLRSLKKPIAFGHYSVKNDISGVTTWLEKLVLSLHMDGVPVVVYIQHFGNDTQNSWLLNSLQSAGVTVHIQPSAIYTDTNVRNTLLFLNKYQPLAFLPQCIAPLYFAAEIGAHFHLPWAMTVHSDDPVYWAIAETVLPEQNNGIVVGVSQFICQQAISRQLSSRPLPIPYGVPETNYKAAFNNASFKVVFSGRLVEEQKRLSIVVDTMIKACQEDSRIECWLIGHGSARESAQKRVEACGLGNRILFLGRLPIQDVKKKLAQCQVILMMSDYEGLPLALLEAMSIGVVPIVRSIPSGIPELIEHGKTGFLVDHKPENAVQSILRLADRPELWRQCSTAARDLIQNYYSEDICYQKWLDTLAKLCEETDIKYPISIARKLALPPKHPDLDTHYIVRPHLVGVVRHKVIVAIKKIAKAILYMTRFTITEK